MKWFIKFYILLFIAITQGEASHRALDILVTSSRCFTPKLHFHSPFRTPALLSISYPLMSPKKTYSGPLIVPRPFAPSTSTEFIDIVHPCSDFGFKLAFGDPEVAMGFLNTILSLSGDDIIKELLYVDKELPSLVPEGRDFRVDVLCRTSKGEWFLLEMQNDYRADNPDKAFIEFCRLVGNLDSSQHQPCSDLLAHEQESKLAAITHPTMYRDFWKSVPRVIALAITNKEFTKRSGKKERFREESVMEPEVINTYTMRHTTSPDRRLGNIDARIVLVMLANFQKTETKLETDMDRWLFALKDEKLRGGSVGSMDAYKHVSSVNITERNGPSLRRFYQLLDRNGIGGDQLRKYEESIMAVNSVLTARYKDGYEKGRYNVLLKAVRALHEAGKSNSEIALSLDIDEAEVESMKNKKEEEEVENPK